MIKQNLVESLRLVLILIMQKKKSGRNEVKLILGHYVRVRG